MNRLSSIIGPAPSEIPRAEYYPRHTTERNRVREALAAFEASFASPAATKKRSSAASTKRRERRGALLIDELTKKAQQAGVDVDVLLKLLSSGKVDLSSLQ